MLNMKRSSWASGSGYVPSCSIGFCVAMTKNGSGRLYVSWPALTWRSCIACSRAAWVLGGVRLISSASRMLVKIGPLTKRNSRRPWSFSSRTVVPVMSEGIRSGVNWMRLKATSRIWLIELTMSVLARPGTPTSRQWPRVKTAARICSRTSAWPTMARRSWSIIWVRAWLNWARYSPMRSVDTAGSLRQWSLVPGSVAVPLIVNGRGPGTKHPGRSRVIEQYGGPRHPAGLAAAQDDPHPAAALAEHPGLDARRQHRRRGRDGAALRPGIDPVAGAGAVTGVGRAVAPAQDDVGGVDHDRRPAALVRVLPRPDRQAGRGQCRQHEGGRGGRQQPPPPRHPPAADGGAGERIEEDGQPQADLRRRPRQPRRQEILGRGAEA